MQRFRGIVSLAVLAGVLFLLLRALHLGIPVVYPKVLQGPFSLASVAEVEEYAGFSPLVPFFRPGSLGERPVHVTVTRGPRARVTVFWQGERFLYLEERAGGGAPPVPENARPWELRTRGAPEEARWWRRGRTVHAVARRGDHWVEIRTDLTDDDARRIVETLRPYRELL
jgi:hypothetical protein